jgi:hypothetical protein
LSEAPVIKGMSADYSLLVGQHQCGIPYPPKTRHLTPCLDDDILDPELDKAKL